MLDILRRAVRSWVAKILLGLLVLSFAVWGIGDVAGGFSTRVATVGDTAVEADMYATVLQREQQRYQLDPTQVRATQLDRFVLAQMVREAALDDAAAKLGVSAPDSAVARAVRSESAFQVGGTFDPVQYQNAVRRTFPSVAAYEETVRRSIASRQIQIAAQQGAIPPAGMVDAMWRWRDERRAFDVLSLTPDMLAEPLPEPTEDELTAHLEANAEQFQAPERRAATWIHIDPAALAPAIAEEELRAEYDARRREFEQPETRAIDQIVYPTEAEAEAALARLAEGADFDALLAERGLTRADADLGAVEATDLPDARGEIAFALSEPGVAGPARTATGWALMEVSDIHPGRSAPFEEVRDGLEQELRVRLGRPVADRMTEQVIDLQAGGATLEEIAEELSLPLDGSEGVTRAGTGLRGVMASREALDRLFDAEPGRASDPFAVRDGGYLALRLDSVRPPVTPPLEPIRAAVAESWRAAREAEALAALAETLRARVAAGEPLTEIASSVGGQIAAIGPLRRTDPDPRLPDAARAALFALAPGDAVAVDGDGGATLAVLRRVTPADAQASEAQTLSRALSESLAQDQLEYLGRALEADAGVSLNPAAIEAALARIGA